jgi:NTP pyrophosphatase (non-canonical NTP hydrolase)
MEMFDKLNKLSEKRIKYFLSRGDEMTWYKWSKTYWEYLEKEIQEAKNEINTNKVYLEDELGDVLWDFLCLLNSLKLEWKISSVEKIIDRAWTKFSWRINTETWDYNGDWEKIKKKQKEKLEKEVNDNL